MENLHIVDNAPNKEKQFENQINILMDLIKIPAEERNFQELKKRIEKMMEEKEILAIQIQSHNDDNIQIMAEISPMERILNTPGLVHLAEKIFDNVEYKPYNLKQPGQEVCYDINQSSRQILDDPKFWLRKFEELSKENQKDWINVIQSENDSKKKKAIVSYLQWNLREENLDIPCYTSPDVQEDFKKKIWQSCKVKGNSYEETQIVKILAPLMTNSNAPDTYGRTPVYFAAQNGHTEMVKTLVPLTDNPNAPNNYGWTPIYLAAQYGHTEIVKIMASLTENPNAPDKNGRTPIYQAAINGHIEIVKILAPLTDNPNAPDKLYSNLYGSRIWPYRNCQNIGPINRQS